MIEFYNSFSENLKMLRKSKHLSQDKLAEELGLSRSVIGMYEAGQRKPSFETQELIADYFNVRLDDLLGRSNDEQRGNEIKAVRIPVLGAVVAGVPLEAIQEILDYEEISSQLASQGEFFALKIKGNSMEPKMSEGDVVIVRKQEDVENGDIAIVLVNGNEATVKKIKKFDGGINLIPFNNTYDVITFSNKQIEGLPIRIIGKVVELRAKF